ncbi:hypothetical protein ACQUQP_11360 [Marinobacterium sp. YM272]|uniref:hypothetical protein n=1 Tax=Marinobacterium sp. YM272 TaxID=3421654 RepID=UPI003D7FFE4A
MSFRRDYLPLFGIHFIDHSSGDPIPGVSATPLATCQRALNDHQLLFKTRPFGCQVYYSTNPWASSPVLGEVTRRVSFDFSLHLPGDFYQRYLPDLTERKQLHLHNLANNGDIKAGNTVTVSAGTAVAGADAVRALPKRFEIPLNLTPATTELQVRRQFGSSLVTSIDRDELGEGERIGIDLRQLDSGRYRLATDDQPGQHTHVLLDNELASGDAQGMVSIVMDDSQQLAPAEGFRFEVRFEPR